MYNVDRILTTLPSPLPKSTIHLGEVSDNTVRIREICVGVAGTYGRQYLRSAGDIKGTAPIISPTLAPPIIHPKFLSLFVHLVSVDILVN